MTTTARQNNLILSEDWTKIYQTFKNADFKSYDFENLRRVMITYLRENYPEDFNDYIESSEYLALIDAIAFLGQSLAFRIDLASRENFIDLADRKESVLRLAKMLSYNAKRNKAASGLLKFDTVSTTEPIIDSNGRTLSKQTIVWNDPTNANWYEQFLLVLNSAMASNLEFGNSQGEAVIDGIRTQQYVFNTFSADVPIFAFTKAVAARSTVFEIVSTIISENDLIVEEQPTPGTQMGFLFRSDGRGASSANTGFYFMFKQGSLELADFAIEQPTTNEKVSVENPNINNDDVWLFSLGANGVQGEQWTQVSNLIGNNIIYNSVSKDIRNIYSVVTNADDKIDLQFSDGIYGNLPRGSFRVYYRVSNGLSYSITPSELRGITIDVPYINKAGTSHTLTISLGLKYTVANSSASEDIESIRTKAPAVYYTQNRMITAEDYNLAPLSSSQDILKIKAINRTSSGISRNFDIIDASGKYSTVNTFSDDGLIYKNELEKTIAFKFNTRAQIINFIKNVVESEISQVGIYNFYLTKFDKVVFSDNSNQWIQVTKDIDSSTGYFQNANDQTKLKVGNYTPNILRFFEVGSLVKFVPPAGKAFKNGEIVNANINDATQTSSLWVKVINVVGDGTNADRGVLANGLGPITFSEVIPTLAAISRIVPKFTTDLTAGLELEMVNLMFSYSNFGLQYSKEDRQWKIITASNLNINSTFFSLANSGNTSGLNLDSSWLLAFVFDGVQYNVHVREMDYVFESIQQNRFYFDNQEKVYDSRTGKVIKDQINIVGINSDFTLLQPLKQDIRFEIKDSLRFSDGYQTTGAVKLGFFDSDDDGIIDNPESFEIVAGEDQNLKYLFFQRTVDEYGAEIYKYVDNTDGHILIRERTSGVNINDDVFQENTLVYFYDINEDVVKRVTLTRTGSKIFTIDSSYRANIGRDKIKFQYIHHASDDRRIDPSVSNIIDVYILTNAYETAYLTFVRGGGPMPTPPNSNDLRNQFGGNLNNIKSVSDEIVYHPVQFKPLFGANADPQFRAQFKVVKNSSKSISDNDLKVRIINSINEFFSVDGWDFGDKFYFSEMATYVINSVSPDISNFVIVPRQTGQEFGSLFEIQSRQDEIFTSAATVDDIQIVSGITASEINVSSTSIISNTSQ
jgi:hypothetical protein